MLGRAIAATRGAATAAAAGGSAQRIGILAMESYFPKRYVDQSDLEAFDGVGAGKYVKGLGQESMSFCDDREDINSIALTAVRNLLDKHQVRPADVGRLEVGTETIVDKSKSVKSTLMELFGTNTAIEGIDTTNACYGGTSALFNALQWMESSYWDGRYAVVVAGDIAVYEKGNARPTGGAGCVAMLIGPNAPLVFEQGIRGTYMEHAWDFYKPDLLSEYPRVDGKLSNDCYIRALDRCLAGYHAAFSRRHGRPMSLEDFDYAVFHSPYSKLVQKSWARMHYIDFLLNPKDARFAASKLQPYAATKPDETYNDRDIMNAALADTAASYEEKVAPALYASKRIGNSYCGSTYFGLHSLVELFGDRMAGKRVSIFSYGSGLAASLFSLRVEGSVAHIAERSGLVARFNEREKATPQEFTDALQLRENTHHLAPYQPVGDVKHLFPGTYYLDRVDELHRRHYLRTPSN